jgi:hypothetical protein
MQWFDHDAELRRAEQYSDISWSAFVIATLSLSLVAVFAFFMFVSERAAGG